VIGGVDPESSYNVVAQSQTGTYTENFSCYNNHLYITINNIVLSGATGTIRISGTSISESTAVPVSGSEDITISSSTDTSYQSLKNG